jgi:ribonuclease P protein component
MRELFRKHQTLGPPEHDLLIVARGAINRLEYAEIERKFVEACRKAFPATAAPRSDA